MYPNQTVVGMYNVNLPDDLFEVGGGTDTDTRKTLFAVEATGDLYSAPDVQKTTASGVTYQKHLGIVTVHIYTTVSLSTSWKTIMTLPSGCRPTSDVYFACTTISNNTNVICHISTGGVLSLRIASGSSASYSVQGSVAFIIA